MQYDAFMSHTQRSKKAVAYMEKLATGLKEHGFSNIWFDVNMPNQDEEAMRLGVQNSQVVIAFITGSCINPDSEHDKPTSNAYFNRAYCLKELRWAIEYQVPIILAMDNKDDKKFVEFSEQVPSDLEFLLATQVRKLDRSNPYLWNGSVQSVIEPMRTLRKDGLSDQMKREYKKSRTVLKKNLKKITQRS